MSGEETHSVALEHYVRHLSHHIMIIYEILVRIWYVLSLISRLYAHNDLLIYITKIYITKVQDKIE